jgi:hypothetical protein
MTRNQRLAVLALVAVLAVGGFIVARSSGGDGDEDRASPAPAATTQAPQAPARPAPPPVPEVRIRSGKPVGGVQRLTVKRGERVRFVVVSDVEDHVHVHGYDLFRDVAPGRPARFDFPARIDGLFEVELEDRAEQIISLRVRP